MFRPVALLAGLAMLAACSSGGNGNGGGSEFVPPEPEDTNIITIQPGENFEKELKTALIEAQPGCQ
jgi:hypothetical protein